ncbi:LysR family transcriptional regulator [Herbaspirillum sp. SJZ099]|uniref:LysR family transcriptional regulator n=1 Tax=Herbaspirillum sp. SJZ099 TaxID=2572916 RepID=UPI0011A175DD|nr:LysR family transcriptional regulator [Herbaspirillum sp. SJZ099]TWC68324.1 LysR family transcriptional regulator [Herbaspirillum sp. SJZ099]
MDARNSEMAVFVKVADMASFSAAARALKLTPSAVGKLVTRMEERLGVLLFQRSTRHMALTPEGKLFYESCVCILDDIERAESDITQKSVAAHGHLRISVTLPFGTHQVLPLIPEFHERYPGIILDISLTDALVDLQKDQADIAIRMGPLADASIHARKLGQSRRAVVASPAYLKRFGIPQTPDDLVGHKCFNFNFRRAMDEWPFKVGRSTVRLPVTGGMLTNNGETMRELTLAGLGIGRLGMFHVGPDIQAGRLVEILKEYNPGDIEDIHAIYNSQRYMPARVRLFIDFLIEKLADRLRADAFDRVAAGRTRRPG